MKKYKSSRLRFLVMLAVLAVVAVGYFTAGGIGNFCGIGFENITLLCPLGALLAMLAERTAIPMAVVSVVAVLVVCVVLGKVFCAWACPVHFLSRRSSRGAANNRTSTSINSAAQGGGLPDSVPNPVASTSPHGAADDLAGSPVSRAAQDGGLAGSPVDSAAQRGGLTTSTPCVSTSPHGAADELAGSPMPLAAQVGEPAVPSPACATCSSPCGKAKGIKIDSRHGILAAALGSTLVFGFPVFCLICPVGLTFATVLLVMRLFAFGDTTWTVLVFPAIIALEILLLPKWCQRFCPLGALLSLLSGLNRTFRPQINAEACLREGQGKACNLCERACPEGINLHDLAAGETTLNDCSKCRACADACPEGAITFPLLPKQQRVAARTPDVDELPERW